MGWDIEEFQIFLIGLASKHTEVKFGLTLKFTATSKECKKEKKELRLETIPTQVRFRGLE